jgi:hypothetical protein
MLCQACPGCLKGGLITMTKAELLKLLAPFPDDARIVVQGKDSCGNVAEADLVIGCSTVPLDKVDSFSGDRRLKNGGEPAIWIGWSKEYAAEYTLMFLNNPDDENL